METNTHTGLRWRRDRKWVECENFLNHNRHRIIPFDTGDLSRFNTDNSFLTLDITDEHITHTPYGKWKWHFQEKVESTNNIEKLTERGNHQTQAHAERIASSRILPRQVQKSYSRVHFKTWKKYKTPSKLPPDLPVRRPWESIWKNHQPQTEKSLRNKQLTLPTVVRLPPKERHHIGTGSDYRDSRQTKRRQRTMPHSYGGHDSWEWNTRSYIWDSVSSWRNFCAISLTAEKPGGESEPPWVIASSFRVVSFKAVCSLPIFLQFTHERSHLKLGTKHRKCRWCITGHRLHWKVTANGTAFHHKRNIQFKQLWKIIENTNKHQQIHNRKTRIKMF